MRPYFVIIGGPNGAGKTTITEQFKETYPGIRADSCFNPDALAAKIVGKGNVSQGSADLEAANRIEDLISNCLDSRENVVVETVLSTDKYAPYLEKARRSGYKCILVFVTLSDLDLSLARVASRVKMGGHHVDEHKIRNRWQKSHENFHWFREKMDRILVFLNDDAKGKAKQVVDIADNYLAHMHVETPHLIKQPLLDSLPVDYYLPMMNILNAIGNSRKRQKELLLCPVEDLGAIYYVDGEFFFSKRPLLTHKFDNQRVPHGFRKPDPN